jgi:hypothetical protein
MPQTPEPLLLDARQRRVAAHLADAIASGYRARLRRDSRAFVLAVAAELAARWGVTADEAAAELARHHEAII